MVLTFLRTICVLFIIFFPTELSSQTVRALDKIVPQRHHVLHTVNGIIEQHIDVTDEHADGTVVIPDVGPRIHVNIVYWLHGKYGYNDHDLNVRLVTGLKLLNTNCGDSKFIVIVPKLPWAANNTDSDTLLVAVSNFNTYHDAMITLLSPYKFVIDDVYIIAYSAGGNIILRLSRLCKSTHDDVNKYHVYMVDANYKERLQILWNNCRKSDMFKSVTVTTRDRGDTRENADQFFKRYQTSLKYRHVVLNGKSHIKMGDTSYNVLYDDLCSDKDKK